MAKNRALAHIKQLCCLGLGSQAIMPALLKELHGLIPSYANRFVWADKCGRVSNFLAENLHETEEQVALYFREFYNRREREVIWSLPRHCAPGAESSRMTSA
jgi:hypothetical protein